MFTRKPNESTITVDMGEPETPPVAVEPTGELESTEPDQGVSNPGPSEDDEDYYGTEEGAYFTNGPDMGDEDEDDEPQVVVKSFPFQTRMHNLDQMTDALADYVLFHEDQIQDLFAKVAEIDQLKADLVGLRAQMLQSAGYTSLLRQIQLARHVIDSHVKAPHRAGN